MYTLEDRLSNLDFNELYKIHNSNKEIIFIKVSVFNAGAVNKVIASNNYNKYSNFMENNYNGYNMLLENSAELHYTVEEMIVKKYHRMLQEWAKNCYYYQFSDYLKLYKLSDNKYFKIRSLYNKNCNKYKLD